MAIEAMKLELDTVQRGEIRIAEGLHGLDLKRQYIVKRHRAMPKMQFAYPTAAFYVFMDLAQYFEGSMVYPSNKSDVLHDVNDFCDYLIRKTGVAVAPGTDMGEPNGIRVSYVGSMNTMMHAMDGLEYGLNSLTFA